MKKILLSAIVLLVIQSCKRHESSFNSNNTKILMLKVDYLTNNFEGGKEIFYSSSSSNFTVSKVFKEPSDYGYLKLVYNEMNDTIFSGTIIWAGVGGISIPQNLLSPNQFNYVTSNDTIIPSAGFEDLYNPFNQSYDYLNVWYSVQKLALVRNYLNSNPNGQVKIFMYTPAVGTVFPEYSKWIIYLKN